MSFADECVNIDEKGEGREPLPFRYRLRRFGFLRFLFDFGGFAPSVVLALAETAEGSESKSPKSRRYFHRHHLLSRCLYDTICLAIY